MTANGSGAICGCCGWPELHVDLETGESDCRNCFGEWRTRKDYETEITEQVQDEWRRHDEFIKNLLRERRTEKTLSQIIVGLLAIDAAPDTIELVVLAANSLHPRPCPTADVGDLMLKSTASWAGVDL